MRFIENNELREWVKDNLRKTIFQKAHSLAVQTGCEVLVKLQDVTDAAGCQYYATTTLQQAYKMSNLRQPGEMAVSGETGMPMFPMVDRAIQSGDDSTTGYASSLAADSEGGDGDDGQGELNGLGQGGIVPMQLSMTGAGDQGTDPRTQMPQRSDSEQSSHPSTPATSMGLPMQVKTEPGSDLMDLIGLIPGSGDGSTPNIKQEPPGDDKSSDGTVSYGDNDDIIDVTPAQQAAQQAQAQQAAQQMQMMFQQQQQAAAAAAQGMGSPPTSPYGAAAQLQAFSQGNVPAAQGSPSGMPQRYQVPMAPKPYQCATCQKAFGSIQLLQKHTQTFHMRAQNVMAQKSRGRGRGSRGGSRGGSSQRMNWSPSQSPQRFPQPGQGDVNQQQWLQQVSAASGSPSQAQLAQAQALGQSPGGTSPSASQYGQHSPSAFPSSGAGPSRASPQARRQLIGSSPSRGKSSSTTTRHRHSLGKRFALATARGIMSGVLLTPGPVSTHKALKNLSMAFNVAVTKTKFISACNRLQAANLGFLVQVDNKNRQAQVFVKRPPDEVQMIIESRENSDLTTFLEYSQRYGLPPSAAVTQPIKEKLVQMGMVRPEHFKEKPGGAPPGFVKSEIADEGGAYM